MISHRFWAPPHRWQINFTPTVIFFPNEPAAAEGKVDHMVEAARTPCCFKPYRFGSVPGDLPGIEEGPHLPTIAPMHEGREIGWTRGTPGESAIPGLAESSG